MEFVSHIVRAYCNASGNNEERASKAITSVGSSVLSGITLTKILGVSVLAFAKSQVSRMIDLSHACFFYKEEPSPGSPYGSYFAHVSESIFVVNLLQLW